MKYKLTPANTQMFAHTTKNFLTNFFTLKPMVVINAEEHVVLLEIYRS